MYLCGVFAPVFQPVSECEAKTENARLETKNPGFIGVFPIKPGLKMVAGVGFEPTTFRL